MAEFFDERMVAISLYRGNLHRVPDVPRRWLMPKPTISLKEFRTLLARRSQALSRSTSSEPAHGVNPSEVRERTTDLEKEDPCSLELRLATGYRHHDGVRVVAGVTDACDKSLGNGDDMVADKIGRKSNEGNENETNVIDAKFVVIEEKELNGPTRLPSEATEEDHSLDQSKEKVKALEEELQVLQERRHNYVQVFKQILNAEEQLKPKSLLVNSIRPLMPLQGDSVNDFGTMSRQIVPRLSLDPNVSVSCEAGAAEDACTQNIHSRHVNESTSLSPSSESPARKFFHQNMIAHPSPSRFAPIGFQGNTANPPSISLSGTNYNASSPSPAASGGTSAFRDGRQPSPWS